MAENMESPEYLSIDDAAKAIGWNRATVYKYVDELGMKKYKFRLNRKTFLAAADVEKLKQIKEKPWIAGIEEEKIGQKSEEDAGSQGHSVIRRQFCYAVTPPTMRGIIAIVVRYMRRVHYEHG